MQRERAPVVAEPLPLADHVGGGAAASASTVGQRSSQRCQRGTTRSTCVCCDITSQTRIAYGSSSSATGDRGRLAEPSQKKLLHAAQPRRAPAGLSAGFRPQRCITDEVRRVRRAALLAIVGGLVLTGCGSGHALLVAGGRGAVSGVDLLDGARFLSPTRLAIVTTASSSCPAVPDRLLVEGRRTIRLDLSEGSWRPAKGSQRKTPVAERPPPDETCTTGLTATPMVIAVDPKQVDVHHRLTIRLYYYHLAQPATLIAPPLGSTKLPGSRHDVGTAAGKRLPDGTPDAIHKIRHVVIIMQENRSFDSYFGTYPGSRRDPDAAGHPAVCVPDPTPHHCSAPVPRHVRPQRRRAARPPTRSPTSTAGRWTASSSQARAGPQRSLRRNPDAPGCSRTPTRPDVMGYHDAARSRTTGPTRTTSCSRTTCSSRTRPGACRRTCSSSPAWSAKCSTHGDPMSC